MLKNRYAKGNNGIVDINELTDATRYDFGAYECYGCGSELIPKLGKKNTWHFAHKIDANCSTETYLHLVSKSLFAETYSECLAQKKPYFMEIEKVHSCNQFSELFGKNQCKKTISEHVDLTRFYDKIEVEKPIDGFIPDILLSSSHGKQTLFVEIAVTHPCDDNKINSKNKILEFKIKFEEDLKIFKEHTISTKLQNITTYNFRSTEISNVCQGNCEEEVEVFVVYQNKKCILEYVKAREINEFLNNRKIIYHEIDGAPEDTRKSFKDKIRKAHSKNIPIINCHLCKFYVELPFEEHIFCKYFQKEVLPDISLHCRDYQTFSNLKDYNKNDRDGILFLERNNYKKIRLEEKKKKEKIKDKKERENLKKKIATEKEAELKRVDDVIKAFNEKYLQQVEERKKKT